MSDSLQPHGLHAAHQAPVSMGFSRQEHGSGWPFPSPGDLPDSGTEPVSPTLLADSLESEHQGSFPGGSVVESLPAVDRVASRRCPAVLLPRPPPQASQVGWSRGERAVVPRRPESASRPPSRTASAWGPAVPPWAEDRGTCSAVPLHVWSDC